MEIEVTKKLWNIATRKVFKSPYLLDIMWGNPIDPKKLFHNQSRFYLELGSGWGEVAIELAKKFPDTGFILLEKKPERLRHTIKEIEKNNIDNIRFLTANFNWFLTEFFVPESFHEVLLNFPDPWPKKRHHKHRTMNESFPEKLLHLLKNKGVFQFATDYGPYGRSGIKILRKFNEKFSTPELKFERPDFPISQFENEKKLEGKNIYYIKTYKL